MSVLRELLGSTIRGEMRKRVDQILEAGEEWNKSAKELKETLEKLTKAIYEGNVEPKTVKPLGAPIRALTKKTNKLARAFKGYRKTLDKIAVQVKKTG